MTYIIGAVELPSNTVIERIGETITTNLGRWGKPKGRGVVYWFGVELPRVRYAGVLSHSKALNYLAELREQFQNPDLGYPLYLMLDENYFFVCERFSWERLPGFRNHFRFDLSVVRRGTTANYYSGWDVSGLGSVENDWGI
ncbi:MAG: hypothetical protein DRO65_03280 [Candidatus Altiarchaeales archaeon]|nr:MAG: hypothetical protein DRO65_03280 [Candidatus Altiarchaeales archaeon]